MEKLEYIPGDLVMTNGVPLGTSKNVVYRVTSSDPSKTLKLDDGTVLKGVVCLENIEGAEFGDKGYRNIFADCFIMTFLISEVCYTKRCKEKLEIELKEAKEKLKEAKGKVMELQNEVIAEQEKYNHWIDVNGKYFKIVQLCRDLWEERYCLEEAKVLLCKKKLTTGGFLEQIKTHEEAIADIENKIRQANIEYKKSRNQH